MSKLGKALGAKYEQNKLSILTRTFQLGDHTFKVRVPNVGEIESIYEYFNSPDESKVESVYQELIKNIKELEVDGDVVVDGRSMREAARNKSIIEYRITEYFKFLIPEDGESLSDLEYADIDSEFPFSIQMEFIDKINEVISPDYKEARGK